MRITKQQTRVNRKGEEVDATIYLERVDSNNLVMKEGTTVLNYFGDVRVALKRALNYAVKGSPEALSLEGILDIVKTIDKNIEELKKTCIEIEKDNK